MRGESGIKKMRLAESYTRNNQNFSDYCFKELGKPNVDPNGCTRPFTALNVFYASEWDTGNATLAMNTLNTSAKIQEFNGCAVCYLNYPDGCDATCMPTSANGTNAKFGEYIKVFPSIFRVTRTWDGMNDKLVAPVDDVLQFCAFFRQLALIGAQVDFFFDKQFSATNQRSAYTRSLYNFGFPLAGYDNKNDNQKAQEDLFKTWFKADIYDKHVVPISATNDADGVAVLTLASPIIFEVILDIVITVMSKMLAIHQS